MLFHTTFKPKAGYTSDDQKRVLQLWAKWTPPEGLEIKSFYADMNGRGFLITEANDAKAIYEGIAVWLSVYLDYDIVPVIPVDEAVLMLQNAISQREAL